MLERPTRGVGKSGTNTHRRHHPTPSGHPSKEGNKPRTKFPSFGGVARSDGVVIPLLGGVARSAGVVPLLAQAGVIGSKKEKGSPPISRVLSSAFGGAGQSFILAPRYRDAPAAYPEAARATPWLPYLALLRMGFTVPGLLPVPRWALTPPFHPCLISRCASHRRFAFCCTFRRLTAPGC